MEIQITKATLEDVDDLLVVLNEALKYKNGLGDDAWGDKPYTREEVEEGMKRGEAYVARADGQAVGCIFLSWNDEYAWGPERGKDNQAGYIHKLSTKDSVRGQDVGGKMVDWARNKIRESGKKYIRLDCRVDNEGLCKYYEVLGFKSIGENKLTDVYTARLYQLDA